MYLKNQLLFRILLARKLRRRMKRKPRETSIRPIFFNRMDLGESLLVRELRNDPHYHHRYFRMTKGNFDELLDMVTPIIQGKLTHSRPISPLEKLGVTLRFLATGNAQISLAMNYRISPAAVSKLLRQTMEALCHVLEASDLPPPSEKLWAESEKRFSENWNFPNCCGAIDGKHVRIRAPSLSGSNNFNYKGYFSVALLAVVDACYRFIVVDIGACGSQSDGGVLARSEFGKALQNQAVKLPPPKMVDNTKLPHVIVGDDAFPLRSNLLKPYPGKFLTPEKRIYNYRLSRARMVVENSFGILAARWRIFHQAIHADLDFTKLVIKTCVILHNFLMRKGDLNITGDRLNEGRIIEGNWRGNSSGMEPINQQGSNNHCTEASKVRDAFMNYFNMNGKVSWQNKVFE